MASMDRSSICSSSLAKFLVGLGKVRYVVETSI